jgi:hypothetical protein
VTSESGTCVNGVASGTPPYLPFTLELFFKGRIYEHTHDRKMLAQELGIRPGTVKIHLKHIFEKTGVRGRHGLALNGLRQKGVISLLAS